MRKKYQVRSDFVLIGVYFFVLKGKVVYIGKTVNFYRRIFNHFDEGCKKFDSIRFLHCNADKIDYYEKRWILRFKPKYNYIHLKKRVGTMHNWKVVPI